MAVTFVVDYEVKDYEIWKKTFDSNSHVRKAAGVKASPFKKIDDHKIVYVIGEAPSKEILEGMFGNPKFIELMKNAGVITKPNVVFLKQ
jgi:hypothetical protein